MKRTIGALAALLILSMSGTALAQSDPAPNPAQAAMESYFADEKLGGMLLVGLGVAGLASGAVLTSRDSPTAKGMSYPILGIGLLHAAAGIFVYIASDNRIDDYTADIAKDDAAFVARESVRIDGVHNQFFALKIVEAILIATGAGLAVIGTSTDRHKLRGVGFGLAIQATVTLGFDIWAAQRAKGYDQQLSAISVTVGQSPETGETLPMITFVKRF